MAAEATTSMWIHSTTHHLISTRIINQTTRGNAQGRTMSNINIPAINPFYTAQNMPQMETMAFLYPYFILFQRRSVQETHPNILDQLMILFTVFQQKLHARSQVSRAVKRRFFCTAKFV